MTNCKITPALLPSNLKVQRKLSPREEVLRRVELAEAEGKMVFLDEFIFASLS